MLMARIIPVLLLKGSGLVKTVKFKDPKYIGDPRNAVKIFNEKEVDELIVLDVNVSKENKPPQFNLIKEIISEAFMPVAYGGGIKSIDDAKELFGIGVEKIVINSYGIENPSFIKKVSDVFGSQSIVVSIDAKKNIFGKYQIYASANQHSCVYNPIDFAKIMEDMGAGEIFINSVDRDGGMTGYDLNLIKNISESVKIPVVACGGAGAIHDLEKAVKIGGAGAAAAGSMFVFHGKHRAVLISYPDQKVIKKMFI